MGKRILLISVAAAAAVAIVIAFAASASGQPRLAKVVDCIQAAGYRTTGAVHDNGRRPMLSAGQDPDVQLFLGASGGTRQAREPSDTFTVVGGDSALADISVPQRSAITLKAYHRLPVRTRTTLRRCLATSSA